MKTILNLTGVAAAAALAALPLRAADGDIGPYVNFEGGPSWAQSVRATSGGYSGTADLDVGARFGFAIGYNFHPYFGVEFDTGWAWNDFKDSAYSLTQVPMLVNGTFRFPNQTGFEPYVGGGAGGVWNTFGVSDCCGDYDSDVVFAWQGLAGVRYKFNPNMALGLGYKYLGTLGGEFTTYGIRTELDTMHNHSVNLVWTLKF